VGWYLLLLFVLFAFLFDCEYSLTSLILSQALSRTQGFSCPPTKGAVSCLLVNLINPVCQGERLICPSAFLSKRSLTRI